MGTNGRLLAVGGMLALVLALWYRARGHVRLRVGIGASGFALAAFCGYLVAQLLAAYRALGPIFVPALGPGLFVATAGALLILSTLFLDVRSIFEAGRSHRIRMDGAGLVALSAGAGAIHLAVAAEHFVEYRLYGVFFVALGIAQIGWAALVAIRGPSRALARIAMVNVLVIGLWVLSRTTGLPVGPHPGIPEAVGFADLVSTAFELGLVAWAVGSRWELWRNSARFSRLRWAPVLATVATTFAAILSAVGALGPIAHGAA